MTNFLIKYKIKERTNMTDHDLKNLKTQTIAQLEKENAINLSAGSLKIIEKALDILLNNLNKQTGEKK